MTGFIQTGLGDATDSILPDLSTVSGMFWAIVGAGAGGWVLLKLLGVNEKRSSRASNREYAAYMTRKHKLSAADRRWLEEHE